MLSEIQTRYRVDQIMVSRVVVASLGLNIQFQSLYVPLTPRKLQGELM